MYLIQWEKKKGNYRDMLRHIKSDKFLFFFVSSLLTNVWWSVQIDENWRSQIKVKGLIVFIFLQSP